MFNNITKLFRLRERFAVGAAVLTITTFFSYVTGLMRDRLFARTFGASRALDIYNTSFLIPDLLLMILVASALSAAFIPVFTSLYAKGENENANRLANTVMNSAVVLVVVLGTACAIFMPLLAKFLAPGFSPEELQTLIKLSRLMFISPVIMAVSSSLGAMLVSFKRFLPYGLSAIFYNLGIIGGTLLVPWLGIYGLVAGTLFGALLHLIPRLFSIQKSQFKYRFGFKFKDKNFIQVVKLMIPKMIGHPVEQFTFLGFTRIATLLAAGSVAAVNFARNFQSVPVSIFGISFAVAIYPTLAENAAQNDIKSFLKNFWKALRDILFFTIPIALGMFLLSDLPIKIFLGGGNFTDENISRTASVLAIFSISIPFESLMHLLARAFYSLKNTIIPVLASVLSLALSVGFAYLKSPSMGIIAIPYGFLLGSAARVACLGLVLYFFLRKRGGEQS